MHRLYSRALGAALALCLALASIPAQAADTVWLTSLEWPPYVGEQLAEQGASAVVVREALTSAGKELKIGFYPWARAVETAKKDQNFIGYFPEYYAKEIEAEFIFSDSIGTSPLGFVQNAASPVSWSSLADLKGKTIGTVQGYVNTAEFDAMAASGELTVEPSSSDATNIKKLAAGRIDMAVIDKSVLAYLLATDPDLKALAAQVSFNDKLLEEKTLHVCFRRTDAGQAAADALNAALGQVDPAAIQKAYFDKAFSN